MPGPTLCQDITPPWLAADKGGGGLLAGRWHEGRFYMACLYEEAGAGWLQVGVYDPLAGGWDRSLAGPLEAAGAQTATWIHETRLQWCADKARGWGLHIATPFGHWFLNRAEPHLASPLPLGQFDLDQLEYGLDPYLQSALARLELRPGARVSQWLKEGPYLYAAVDDDEYGFALWRTELAARTGQWHALIERGAERFVHNRQVFALIAHKGWLFIAAGTAAERRWPESAFFDYRGFELLRLAPTSGLWELLCGVPRVSTQGLKLPLTALGPSLGGGARREWRLLHAQAGRLLLGAQDEEGFGLWCSQEGEDWQPLTCDGLAPVPQVRGAQVLGCEGQRALLRVDITRALQVQPKEINTRLWLLDLRALAP